MKPLRLRSAIEMYRPATVEAQTVESERVAAIWESSTPIAGTPGAEYLAGRGIPLESAESDSVHFSSDYYDGPAMIFPLRDHAGTLAAIEGRYIDGRAHPYQLTGEKKRGAFLTLGALTAPALAIVEGPIDALALAAVGLPAVALCGKVAPEWLFRVGALRPVLIALDADAEGDHVSEALRTEFARLASHVLRLRPRGAKDWAELLEHRGSEVLRSALRGFSSEPLVGVVRELAGVTPLTNDDIRIREAERLAKSGRLKEARFVIRMLEGGLEFRIQVEQRIMARLRTLRKEA